MDTTPAQLPPACARLADSAKFLADLIGTRPTDWPDTYTPEQIRETIIRRTVWDAPAAGEINRPIFKDGADLALLAPELAEHIWHHVGGATIIPGQCGCMPPAPHRDALAALAMSLGSMVPAAA